MRRTGAVVIGGGQAGLAMSHCLSESAVDHVVLERGRVAERWRSERWDSLRLLTPSWQSRLPGFSYRGPDPDGYMTMPELVEYFSRYARSFDAPVRSGTNVLAVERTDSGYRVTTDQGVWQAANVVVATGHCDVPFVPEMGSCLGKDVTQLVPTRYKNPRQLPDGGVLVVGASASGIQIADELERSGRHVTLSVGRHTRLPRRYRGRDIMWWFDRLGIVDERAEDVPDVEASRRQPSLQIAGRPERLDLAVLQERGVQLVGRASRVDGRKVEFSDDLAATVVAAEAKLSRLLARIDGFVERSGLRFDAPEPVPVVACDGAPTQIDLRSANIKTVVWATGFRRHYPWLKVPLLDERGELRHHGGITPSPGLYVLGLRFLRRRNSSFIDGVGKDAEALTRHLVGRLERGRAVAC